MSVATSQEQPATVKAPLLDADEQSAYRPRSSEVRSHASDSGTDFSKERAVPTSQEQPATVKASLLDADWQSCWQQFSSCIQAYRPRVSEVRSHASDSDADFTKERAIFANFFAFDAVTSVVMISCVCGYFCGGLWRDVAAEIEDMNTHTISVAIGFFAPLALLFVGDATMCLIIVRRFDQGVTRGYLFQWLLPKLALTGALTGTWLVFKCGLFLDIATGAIKEKHTFQFSLSIILTIVIAWVKCNKMVQTIKCCKRLSKGEEHERIQPVWRVVHGGEDPTYKIGCALVLSSVSGFFLVWLIYNSMYNGYKADNSSAATIANVTIANVTARNSPAASVLEEDVGDDCGMSDVIFPAFLGSAVADFVWAFVIGIVVMVSKNEDIKKDEKKQAGLAAAAALALIVGPANAIYTSQEPCTPGKSFCGGFAGAFIILSLGLSKYFGFDGA